jgi:hypothetical protein
MEIEENTGFVKIEEIIGKSIKGDMEFIVMEKQF